MKTLLYDRVQPKTEEKIESKSSFSQYRWKCIIDSSRDHLLNYLFTYLFTYFLFYEVSHLVTSLDINSFFKCTGSED